MSRATLSARERALEFLRSVLGTRVARVTPPRQRNSLSLTALRRGIFMMAPELRCTVCGSDRVRPSTRPLGGPLGWMGLSAYRCLDCDYRIALPFASR